MLQGNLWHGFRFLCADKFNGVSPHKLWTADTTVKSKNRAEKLIQDDPRGESIVGLHVIVHKAAESSLCNYSD